MGWTPAQVGACSFWQFNVAREGWRRANTTEDAAPAAPSDDEHDALVAKYG